MDDVRAPQEIEDLIIEIARLEQVMAEKRFDESRDERFVDQAQNVKQRI